MRARLLGTAAGGGFPQWNCACALCAGVRAGASGLVARTQTSVAISSDGERWFLLGASPDVHAQIEAFPPLWPRAARRSPIEGILLPSADVDATAGLFLLREGEPLVLLATERVLEAVLEPNALAATLRRSPSQLTTVPLPLSDRVELRDRDGRRTGLVVSAFPVAGKSPPHLSGRAHRPGDSVGFAIEDLATRGRLTFVPCAGDLDEPLLRAASAAEVLLFDGTFWSEDELEKLVPGAPRARAMAHVPVGGRGGSLEALSGCRARRRLFVHVNNTNPMLREDGPERARVRAAGWEVGHDGMEVAA